MSRLGEIRRLLESCTAAERLQLFHELRAEFPIHAFEQRMNATAEMILEALNRAGDLTVRGIRGVLAEATFVLSVASEFKRWSIATPSGDLPFDCLLRDSIGDVRVQVKMQRRLSGRPWIRQGMAVTEVQRTRTGVKRGEATRPYRFGEFDILAVCMEPSHGRWDVFRYIPQRWLIQRPQDRRLIQIMQPVSLESDAIWTGDLDQAVVRLRSGKRRPRV
jgi:hypothetical protein